MPVCVRVHFVQRLSSKNFFKLGIQRLRSSGCTITFILPPLVLSLRQEPSAAKECNSRWLHDKYVHQR